MAIAPRRPLALWARLRRAARAQGGGVASTFAMATPVLVVLIAGAVDLASVNADRTMVQDVADAAALAAAKQLGLVDTRGVAARAQSQARLQLAGLDERFSYTVASDVAEDLSSVTVTIDGTRTSFFANLLPPGGWRIQAAATAAPMAMTPLCVLSSGTHNADRTDLKQTAELIAPACLVHSNGDITVSSQGWLNAATVQSVGTATGRISPQPQVGAPEIEDPFADLALDHGDESCAPTQGPPLEVNRSLSPGTHCGTVIVQKSAVLRLEPGTHFFNKGALILRENARLHGDDVVLIFDKQSKFAFQDQAEIRLAGRRSGEYAGFVIATTRENTQTFRIASSAARELLGAIYIPSATLEVTGHGVRVADQSDWTVIIAKAVKLSGSAKLMVNANYAGSVVPTPDGVGPGTASVALRR